MKRWEVNENMHIDHLRHNVLQIHCRSLDESITIVEEEIDDIIKTLKRVKSHFGAKELARQEKEKLTVWVKNRTLGRKQNEV